MRVTPARYCLVLAAVLACYFVVPPALRYPLDLFLTFLHESGHAVAALLTGGQVLEVVVDPNLAGYTRSMGGWRPAVISGGYLGVAVMGALLMRLNSIPGVRRRVLEITGAFVGLLTLALAGDTFTLLLGSLSAAALVGVGLATNDEVEYLTVTFLAVYVGLGALKEFPTLWALHGGATRVTAGAGGMTDAEAMGALTGTPANLWVVAWLTLSVGLLWYEVRRGARHDPR